MVKVMMYGCNGDVYKRQDLGKRTGNVEVPGNEIL